MVQRTATAALDELSEVVQELGRIASRRARLAAEAWSLGATQAQVAQTLGVSQAAVSRLIRAEPSGGPMFEQSGLAGLGERAKLARMDPDLLGEVLRATVGDAVVTLVGAGREEDAARLAREGRDSRRVNDPQVSIDLIVRARAVLAESRQR